MLEFIGVTALYMFAVYVFAYVFSRTIKETDKMNDKCHCDKCDCK